MKWKIQKGFRYDIKNQNYHGQSLFINAYEHNDRYFVRLYLSKEKTPSLLMNSVEILILILLIHKDVFHLFNILLKMEPMLKQKLGIKKLLFILLQLEVKLMLWNQRTYQMKKTFHSKELSEKQKKRNKKKFIIILLFGN